MLEYAKLVEVIKRLRGEGGCSWDREQTLKSLTDSLIEETYEVVEAIDGDSNADILEELGDLIFLSTFLTYIAEQEGRFDLKTVLSGVSDKLIRRHPHVFGEVDEKDVNQILRNWEQIKLAEPKNQVRKTPFDGIPKGLPEIQRFNKILEKIRRTSGKTPVVEKEALKAKFEEFLTKGDESGAMDFLKGFLIYSFNNKLELNTLTRKISEGVIKEFNEKNNPENIK